MNYKLVSRIVGSVLHIEAFLMLIPLIVALIYGETISLGFLLTGAILFAISIPLTRLIPKQSMVHTKDGFAAVALSWIAMSVFGALPFLLSGQFTITDAMFESISGFTTTGASIITDIERLPRSLVFWRSLTHLVGGMGVLVFVLAVMPSMGGSSIHLMRVEGTGPAPGKLVPKLRQTAKIMYIIYGGLTVLCFILLLFTGMPVFDALIHAMGTAGTGGFSDMNMSIGHYNSVAAEIIITVFMLIFSINFTLYHYLAVKNFKAFYKNEELHYFFIIIAVFTVMITLNLLDFYGGSVSEALRHSTFQVSSMISTTGFSSYNYELWPTFSKTCLLLLGLIGGSAGSTAGGIKIVRLLVLVKLIYTEIRKKIHPHLINPVKLDGKVVNNDTLFSTMLFFAMYALVFIVSLLIVSLDNTDFTTSFSSVIATISNLGQGLGLVGPAVNFSSLSNLSKHTLSFCMLAGRLEILPMLLLLTPSLWKKA